MLRLSGPPEQVKALLDSMLGGYTGDYCVTRATETSLKGLSRYNPYDLVIVAGPCKLTDEELDSLGKEGPIIVRVEGDCDELCEDQRGL